MYCYVVQLNLVVIHDSVERLNPHGVDVSIQDDPLGAVIAEVGQVPHDAGEQPCKVTSFNLVWLMKLKLLIGPQ